MKSHNAIKSKIRRNRGNLCYVWYFLGCWRYWPSFHRFHASDCRITRCAILVLYILPDVARTWHWIADWNSRGDVVRHFRHWSLQEGQKTIHNRWEFYADTRLFIEFDLYLWLFSIKNIVNNIGLFYRCRVCRLFLRWSHILYRCRWILAVTLWQFCQYNRPRRCRPYGNDISHLHIRSREVSWSTNHRTLRVDIKRETHKMILLICRFTKDIEDMTGYRPGRYWQVTWRFLAPLIMVCILVSSMVSMLLKKPQYSAWIASLVNFNHFHSQQKV